LLPKISYEHFSINKPHILWEKELDKQSSRITTQGNLQLLPWL